MSKTARSVMDKAISFLGVKESPPYSNNVIFNTDYYGHEVNSSAYAWCVVFVWDIFRMAGASDLFYNGKKTAGCCQVLNWGRNEGLDVSIDEGRYGDLILFDWDNTGWDDADHIGFIEKKNSDGSYTTIEGNTSTGNDSDGGEVMRRTRYRSTIRAIIRPKYEEEEDCKVRIEFDVLKKGSKGEDVRALQRLLLSYGYKLHIDGDFGPKTEKYVKELQVKLKLVPDGIVGTNSWNKFLFN